jgi:hypothetical protein
MARVQLVQPDVVHERDATEDGVLEVGKETSFQVQLNDEVRAVRFRLSAVNASERDLRVTNPGPFIIE